MEPGINAPFWSLSFEAFYYAFIGLIFFASGKFRILSIASLSLIAGPAINALFPIWLLGFAVYHLSRRRVLSPIWGGPAAAFGLALLLISPILRENMPNFAFGIFHREGMVVDYIDGIAFSLHLYGMMSYDGWVGRWLGACRKPIRWLGSLTFALYLFHRPLIQLFAAVPIAEPSAWSQRIYLLGGTFLIVATVGRRCELWKYSIGAALRTLHRRMEARRA